MILVLNSEKIWHPSFHLFPKPVLGFCRGLYLQTHLKQPRNALWVINYFKEIVSLITWISFQVQNALQCFDAVGWAAGRASRGTGMVIGLERDADLRMSQLMPLPLTVSCFSKIQIGFTFPVLAHPGSPGKRAVKQVCVCVCLCAK